MNWAESASPADVAAPRFDSTDGAFLRDALGCFGCLGCFGAAVLLDLSAWSVMMLLRWTDKRELSWSDKYSAALEATVGLTNNLSILLEETIITSHRLVDLMEAPQMPPTAGCEC